MALARSTAVVVGFNEAFELLTEVLGVAASLGDLRCMHGGSCVCVCGLCGLFLSAPPDSGGDALDIIFVGTTGLAVCTTAPECVLAGWRGQEVVFSSAPRCNALTSPSTRVVLALSK